MTPHILIVDSDKSAAHITRAGVERVALGATLAIEPDPERGLLSLERRRPNVLIVDPPRHTLAAGRLIQELKRVAPEAMVIVLASRPTPALWRDLQRLGADAYLAKPTSLAVLKETLPQALQTLRQRSVATVEG
jgi:DNA-binding NarL/FixJ family response regulator